MVNINFLLNERHDYGELFKVEATSLNLMDSQLDNLLRRKKRLI